MAGPTSKREKSPRLPLLDIEEDVFLNSILTSNGADVIAKKIYEFIKDDPKISAHLKALYKDGLYSRDAKIKRCLRSRMYFIRQINRNHPNVQQLDLLHAQDYSSLNPFELAKKVKNKKQEDLSLQKNMLTVAANRKAKHEQDDKKKWGSLKDNPEMMSSDNEGMNGGGKEYKGNKYIYPAENTSAEEEEEELEMVGTLVEEDDMCSDNFEGKVLTTTFRNYYNLESGEEVLSEIDEETEKEMKGEYLELESQCNNSMATNLKTYDSRPRNKFEAAKEKSREMKRIAEEWLEEKRKKMALKEKAKRAKGFANVLGMRRQNALDVSISSDEEDLIKSFHAPSSSSSDEHDQTQEDMKNDLKKCTQVVNEVVIDQMAYIRASAAKKNLNLDKYRTEIRKDMKEKVRKCRPSKDDDSDDDKKSGPSGQCMSTHISSKLDRFDEAAALKPRKSRLSLKLKSVKKISAQKMI